MKTDLITKKYGNVVEGPQGFKMPEATARAIEAAMKGLPKDFTYRRLAKSVGDITLDKGERTDISVITTDGKDRDDEVVLPTGIEWKQFNANPVVTFNHNYDELPAGTCQWVKPRGRDVVAKTYYPTKPDDWGDAPWLPSAILHLLQQDPPTCRGKSLGFIPVEVRTATAQEKALRPELKDTPIISKSIALEYAVAPIPCNPDTNTIIVAKGDLDEHTVELIQKAFEELKTKTVNTPNLQSAVAAIAAEAAAGVVDRIPYITLEEFRYALGRRLEFTDEHKKQLQDSIVDSFDRLCGGV